MTTIVEESWESDTIGVPWAEVEGAGETLTIVGTEYHHGTLSLQCACDGSSGGEYCYVNGTIGNNSIVSSRAYYKITDLPPTNNNFSILVNQGAATDIGAVRIDNDGSSIRWQLRYYDNGTYGLDYSSTTVAVDTWYCVELLTNHDEYGSGYNTLWIDGTVVASASGLTNRSAATLYWIQRTYMGERWSTGTIAHTVYVDCITITTGETVGVEEGGGPEPDTIYTFWEPAGVTVDPSIYGWSTLENGVLWYNKTDHVYKYFDSQSIRVMETE